MSTQPTTIREQIAVSYGNLARAHAALERGARSYAVTDHVIRAKLISRLIDGTMKMRSLYYRAVDGQGNTVEFCRSRTRGIAAAKAFFRKALKHHREPHSITLDGHRPSHSALRRMGMNGEFNFRGRNMVTIRCCQYLNNVVEQDHRRVKGRLRPMLGFKTFYNARRVIIGIELAQKIHKRQFAIPIPWQSNPAVIWRHVMAP